MDPNALKELLDAMNAQSGGLVLKQGDEPQAVVLSVARYQELVKGIGPKGASVNQTHAEANKILQKVLVTGGAGFLGSHIVRELLESGKQVVVLDNLYAGRRENIPIGTVFAQADLRDEKALLQIFSQHKVDAVIHTAGLVESEESFEKSEEYLDVNTKATIHLLRVMKTSNVSKFIFTSTAGVYGEKNAQSILETMVTEPLSPYGTSKLLAEQMIAYAAEFFNIQAVVLRVFNAAGAVQEWGISSRHTSHLFSRLLQVALGKLDRLEVYGGDYLTVDGSAVRDFVHVRDVARAHLAALEAFNGQNFRVFNVASGRGYSVKEVINLAAEVTGRMIPMQIGQRRRGDVSICIGDNNLIKQELKFEFKHSDLANILQTAWQQVRNVLPTTSESRLAPPQVVVPPVA